LLSAKKPSCVTHVSGMNCHPSLRKGSGLCVAQSSGLDQLSFSREPQFAQLPDARSIAAFRQSAARQRPRTPHVLVTAPLVQMPTLSRDDAIALAGPALECGAVDNLAARAAQRGGA